MLERNIAALIERRRMEERSRSRESRVADAVTCFAGSMRFVHIHVVLFAVWVVANLPGVPLPKFDPTFVVLATFASVEALFLSTFVLITQNRMAAAAEKRAELDLQISLLAEHEVTRLVQMVAALAERAGIAVGGADLEEMKRDVHPEAVLDELERHERRVAETGP